jgi:hypothetical protein
LLRLALMLQIMPLQEVCVSPAFVFLSGAHKDGLVEDLVLS